MNPLNPLNPLHPVNPPPAPELIKQKGGKRRARRTYRGGNLNNGAQGAAQANPLAQANPFAGAPHPAGFPQFGVGPAGPAPPLPNIFAAPAVVAPAAQGFPQFGVQNPPQNQQNVNMDDVMHNVAQNGAPHGGKRRHRSRRYRR